MSQLALALDARLSPRHLSFLETGRSQPSRQMVHRLCEVLNVPLRERNAAFLAAGYAPVYSETPLGEPVMEPIRRGVEFLLAAHDPYPAIVLDRHWYIVLANRAHARFLSAVLPGTDLPEPANVLRLLLDPALLRPAVPNWRCVAAAALRRLDHAIRAGGDPELVRLRRTLHDLPDVAAAAAERPSDLPDRLLVPFQIVVRGRATNWFNTLAVFGAPMDVTLQEIVIEFLLPADDATAHFAAELAREDHDGRRASAQPARDGSRATNTRATSSRTKTGTHPR
jgi:transcriptional regulator with XRE-family HTH domain